MSQAPIMPFSTDAFLADTLHLTTEQLGAYLMILLATWRNNGVALPDDDTRLARIVRASPTRWAHHLRPALVAFFTIDATGWHQKKLEKTWENVSRIVTKNRANASKGGKAKSLKQKETGLPTATISLKPNRDFGCSAGVPNHIQSKKELSTPHRVERVLSYDTHPAREEPACAMIAPARRRATASSRKTPADEAREAIAQGLDPLTGKPAANLDEEIPA